jgi:hypothetical protein
MTKSLYVVTTMKPGTVPYRRSADHFRGARSTCPDTGKVRHAEAKAGVTFSSMAARYNEIAAGWQQPYLLLLQQRPRHEQLILNCIAHDRSDF